MDSKIADDLALLRARVLAPVPTGYIKFIESTTRADLLASGFDPRTICVVNLEVAESGIEGGSDWFFLNGDGCGNYYFVDTESDENAVLLWSHDPNGFEDADCQLLAHLEAGNPYDCIDAPVSVGEMFLSRTASHGESILDPIKLDEWTAVVSETNGIEYKGFREATNPFTGQVDRFEQPGYCVIAGTEKAHPVHLFCGRVRFDDTPDSLPIAEALASRLRANLLRYSGS